MTRDRWSDSEKLVAFINSILRHPSVDEWVNSVKEYKKNGVYKIENNSQYYNAKDLCEAVELAKIIVKLSQINEEDLPTAKELGASANRITREENEDEYRALLRDR